MLSWWSAGRHDEMANHGGLLAAQGQRSPNIWPYPTSQAVNYSWMCVGMCKHRLFFYFHHSNCIAQQMAFHI